MTILDRTNASDADELMPDVDYGDLSAMCPATGRHAFSSRRMARRALREATESRRIAEEVLGDPNARERTQHRAVRCSHCHTWHLVPATPPPDS